MSVEHTSPMAPRVMSTPPKPKYTPILAAPLPPAPRQPIRSHDSGVRESRKPTRALMFVRHSAWIARAVQLTKALGYRRSFEAHQQPCSEERGKSSQTVLERWKGFLSSESSSRLRRRHGCCPCGSQHLCDSISINTLDRD